MIQGAVFAIFDRTALKYVAIPDGTVNILIYMVVASRYMAEKDYFGVLGKAFDDGRFLNEIRTAIVNGEDEDVKKAAKKKGYTLGPKDIEWLKKEIGEGKTILEIIYEAKGGHGGHGGSYRT